MDESIPKATSESVMEICGANLRCYVLEDGRTVINAEDLNAFFEAMLPDIDEETSA